MAMARLAASIGEPWHVVVVGDGHERAALDDARAIGDLSRLHLAGSDPAAGGVLERLRTS